MKNILLLISLLQINSLLSQSCKGIPKFLVTMGFDMSRSGFSSQEKKQIGVVAIEYRNPQNANSERTKSYQDPSWKVCGYAGTITTAKNGNTYVLPKANVNMLYNHPKDQNTIYVIDSYTGKMTSWYSIPMPKIPFEKNANGLMSSFYDCEMDELIVSTIAGSDYQNEIGKLYSININTKELQTLIENQDIMGVLSLRKESQKIILYGLCRKSEIWSVQVNNKNIPISKPKLEIDLSGLGPRGDDKARKMKQNPDGSIAIFGVPFYYNLTAPVQRQESIYIYQYNMIESKWKLKSIN